MEKRVLMHSAMVRAEERAEALLKRVEQMEGKLWKQQQDGGAQQNALHLRSTEQIVQLQGKLQSVMKLSALQLRGYRGSFHMREELGFNASQMRELGFDINDVRCAFEPDLNANQCR